MRLNLIHLIKFEKDPETKETAAPAPRHLKDHAWAVVLGALIGRSWLQQPLGIFCTNRRAGYFPKLVPLFITNVVFN